MLKKFRVFIIFIQMFIWVIILKSVKNGKRMAAKFLKGHGSISPMIIGMRENTVFCRVGSFDPLPVYSLLVILETGILFYI